MVLVGRCPVCGGELQEAAGYPETRDGRVRIWWVCQPCGYEEETDQWDRVL